MQSSEGPPSRVMDRSNRDAARAIAEIVSVIGDWREEAALMQAHLRFRHTLNERQRERIREIDAGIMELRTELIVRLADAPQKVAGNSRVVDVERALDNIEAAVTALRAKLA
jgi:hypothetical protein